MNGILLINKPAGYTSHDVVSIIRKKFKFKKVGHAGTLDPFATGLLILLINNATKLSNRLESLTKEYEGTILFGNEYDTNDITGSIIDSKEINISLNDIKDKIKEFMPSHMQLPPTYSAIKKDGIKSYHAARKGVSLNLSKREVRIYFFDIIDYKEELSFKTKVSKGTYIRSLARDLGYKLNTFGALSKLNRTKIGNYSLDKAKTIEDIELKDLIDEKLLFKDIPKISFNDYLARLIKNGVYLDERNTNIKEDFIACDMAGNYLAFYERVEDKYKPKYFFNQ